MNIKLNNYSDIKGLKVTIMGLGLNGGGLESARFFAERGAVVTVTDTKDADILAPSINALKHYNINYVLGRHDEKDFLDADIVIKNPAVRPDNKFLKLAKQVETDLSIFLSLCQSTVVAVTGSKGKSTTSAALAWILSQSGKKVFLGGNITISPLSFIDKLDKESIVVLELSSWQLGDLKNKKLLKPKLSLITKIVPDHLDRYGTMEAYVSDKRLIYADQDSDDFMVYDCDDEYGLSFAQETLAKPLGYGLCLQANAPGIIVDSAGECFGSISEAEKLKLVPKSLLLPGAHNKKNIAAAAISALALGSAPKDIFNAAGKFTGIEHRLEFVTESKGVMWYNDSAATVPEAVVAAVESFTKPIILITGGTDKMLDFNVAAKAYHNVKTIVLLEGTGTEKIKAILAENDLKYYGTYSNIDDAVKKAYSVASSGEVVVFSPGCTSFGMFKNEFDRGQKYKEAVKTIVNNA